MNPLAYFALELHHQQVQEAERAIRRRRQRVGDDEAPGAARDRLWAAAIRRFARGDGAAAGAGAAQPRTRTEPGQAGQALPSA